MSNKKLTVGAVLLAAGQSSRFGSENKLLATVGDETIVRKAANTLLRPSLDGRVAVVGHEAVAVRETLPVGFHIRYNDKYRDGQHTSVQEGVNAAREAGWDAAVFVLGDMPFVSPATIESLCEAFEDGQGSIVTPTYNDHRGNPVLFGATHYDVLADSPRDEGGRQLVETHPDTVRIAVDDPGIHRDIDQPEDLEESVSES